MRYVLVLVVFSCFKSATLDINRTITKCINCVDSKKGFYKVLWPRNVTMFHCMDRPLAYAGTTLSSACDSAECLNVYEANPNSTFVNVCFNSTLPESNLEFDTIALWLIVVLELFIVFLGLFGVIFTPPPSATTPIRHFGSYDMSDLRDMIRVNQDLETDGEDQVG